MRVRDPINLQHLRRFVKQEYLPKYVRDLFAAEAGRNAPEAGDDATTSKDDDLCFLLCASRVLGTDEVLNLLESSSHSEAGCHLFELQRTLVPLLPPVSQDQADSWSQQYWPTVYKKSNPFGPHSSILARAEQEIASRTGSYIELARNLGDESMTFSLGLPVGAVIVDRCDPERPSIVAGAGDARWRGLQDGTKKSGGDVMSHAVMRAIGLIAQKRRELLQVAPQDATMDTEQDLPMYSKRDALADEPLTTTEHRLYADSALTPGGYLCLDLEIYVSHEPCIMCSMAILHSRFGRVVFADEMPLTGGLKAEAIGSGAARRVDENAAFSGDLN